MGGWPLRDDRIEPAQAALRPRGDGWAATVIHLGLFCLMMFVPLAAYRLGFELIGPVFPFVDAPFATAGNGQPTPDGPLLNAYLLFFVCVSLLAVAANVVATLVCGRLVLRLRQTTRPMHFALALSAWLVLLALLLTLFHIHERLGYAAADSAPTSAFYATDKAFAFRYLARNMPVIYGYVLDNGRHLADFVFWAEFAFLASFMPPVSLGVLCLAGSGFLPVRAAPGDAAGAMRMLVARHAAIGQALYVLAAMFLFVVAFPSATFKMALAFPLDGAIGAVRDAHPLAQSQSAATLLIAT